MNKNIYTLALLCAPLLSLAQKTNPAPYCASEFTANYNMMKEISVGSYSHSFGAAGSSTASNTYLYVDTAKIPPISTTISSSVFLEFYSAPDPSPSYFAIWIDYDQNKAFDPAELIYWNDNTIKAKLPGMPAPNISVFMSVKAPVTAKNGTTRMRIVRAENPADLTGPYNPSYSPAPCNAKSGSNIGCTYDFNVNILSSNDIDEFALKTQINVSPNPASSFIRIENNSAETIARVAITDMMGKQILSVNKTEEINISALTEGLYWATIFLESGKVETRKFMKQ